MKEIWKDIKKYEGIYQISNLGRCKRLGLYAKTNLGFKKVTKDRILGFSYINGTGKYSYRLYGYYKLSINGIKENFLAGILVAEYFLPKPKNKNYKFIKHLDGDLKNNIFTNLKWSSRSSISGRRISISKYDLKGEFIDSYDSITSAAKELQKNIGNGSVDWMRTKIKECIDEKRNNAYNFKWGYKNN